MRIRHPGKSCYKGGMTTHRPATRPILPRRARIALWSLALALFLVPAIAMQLTDEVNWGPGDFLAWALLLLGLFGSIELAGRLLHNRMIFVLFALLALILFLGIWAELAVGIL